MRGLVPGVWPLTPDPRAPQKMATDIRLKEALPEITEAIVASYAECGRTTHLGHRPLPSREGVIDILNDFLDLLSQWGNNPGGPPDFDGDGTVGMPDFLDLLAHWGPCA